MKKFLGTVLGATLLVSPFASNVQAAEYKDPYDNYYPDDTWDHWAEKDMLKMLQADIVRGEQVENRKQGTVYLYLHPDNTITRAEFVAMIVRALELKTTKTGTNFTDTLGHWAQNDINTASALNVVSGKTATTFDPNGKITRAEISSIIVRAFDPTVNFEAGAAKTFSDLKSTHWAYNHIRQANQVGIISGTSATTVSPDKNATRAEAVSLIKRALGKEEAGKPSADQLTSLVLSDEQDAADATNAEDMDKLDLMNDQNHFGMAHAIWGSDNDFLRFLLEDEEYPYDLVKTIVSEPVLTVIASSTRFAEVNVDNLQVDYTETDTSTGETSTFTEDQSGVYYLIKRDGTWKIYSTDYLANNLYELF